MPSILVPTFSAFQRRLKVQCHITVTLMKYNSGHLIKGRYLYMSGQTNIALKTESTRKFKDKFAKYGVMTGGILVLCALLLIFFYLLYVVKPVFDSAHVDSREATSTLDKAYFATGIEEQTEISYAITPNATVDFFNAEDGMSGQQIASIATEVPGEITAYSQSAPHKGLFGFMNDDARLTIIKPFFKIDFKNNTRSLTPRVQLPFGEEPLPELFDEEGYTVEKFVFAEEEGVLGILYQLQNGAVRYARLEGEENMFTEEIEWIVEQSELDFVDGKVERLLISPDASRIFILTKNEIYVANSRVGSEVELLYTKNISRPNQQITTAKLLASANSLMLGYTDGKITQWFEVNGKSGRDFVQVRDFTMNVEGSDKAVAEIYPEFYRRTFIATTSSGEVNFFHTTSEADLWQGKLPTDNITDISFSPRSNAFVVLSANQLDVLNVENEHPEVTWSGLWQEVWYEGYAEPDYVWQSSSASDDFESKFSLVPISFGTLKAAMYAMLFAVPIGLAAAIYTAYFMAPSVRKIVKPTVEIMEALPTVILGFLAGLWLAPLIEEKLPGVILLILLLPVAIFLTAFAWHNIPQKIRNRMPVGWDSILLIPIVAFVGYFSFEMSPLVEEWLFDGNTRLYITNELGITFDQRNSLIVGIAMGFAVIPTIFSIAEDAVFSVPKTLSSGSLALGATQWQTLIKVVLLTASPGIFSAVMMGLGRAVGETMIVLMATGNTPIMDWSIFQGMRTLSANIAVEMPESEVGSSHYRILFLAAFVLFIFTFVFNTIAEFVRQRLREKYSSL